MAGSENPLKYSSWVVCDSRTSCFAILRSRVWTCVRHFYFFLSYCFSFSSIFCTRQFSAFNSFTFLYISDVKIVKFLIACLSTLVIVCFGTILRGDVLAMQCLLTGAKVSKCGVIHRGQWEKCYGRDTKRIKMHPLCITKLWASYEQYIKWKIRNIILCAQISMNTPTELKLGPRSALNIFPQNLLLRRLDPVHVTADYLI